MTEMQTYLPTNTPTLPPELFLRIGCHILSSDLFSCIQVCHHWYDLFLPALWHTLDSNSTNWRKILQEYDSDLSAGKHDEQWLQDIFNKHGHHIRHLRVHHQEFFRFANLSQGCTQLLSLRVLDVERNLTRKEIEEELLNMGAYDGAEPRRSVWDSEQPGFKGSCLSQELEGMFEPMFARFRSLNQQERNWYAAQHLWLLIAKNPGLMVLHLHGTAFSLALPVPRASEELFYNTFAGLCHLVDLKCYSFHINVNGLLGKDCAPPSLRRLELEAVGDPELWTTFLGLEHLTLLVGVGDLELFLLLKHLPSLDTLALSLVKIHEGSEQDGGVTVRGQSRLRRLEIRRTGVEDSLLAQRVIPLLPHLTSIMIDHLYPLTALALSAHCPNLERIEQGHEAYTVLPQRGIRPAVNSLNVLLQTSTKFKAFIDVKVQIEVEDVLQQRWASRDLEILPCQISGFGRLTIEESAIFDTIPESKLRPGCLLLTEEEHRVMEKQRHSRELQEQVCNRLGELTQLKELDLGYRFENIDFQAAQYIGNYGQPIHRREGLNARYSGPIHDTLELTLDSGLRLLAGLKSLEIIGFEGMDHRIGKEELKWMVETWPKLRMIRGLDAGRWSPEIDIEGRKGRRSGTAELKEYVRELKPGMLFAVRPYTLHHFRGINA
ncbi:hypothetical protein BGZ95_005188 [Linnemannia exigua]|uniref:F-box domain-containing protein n=1 Tax=Linnemannia exigua TaxID=604196 RepID=A0AAD4DNK5_9FUNG|nr:hypothetical protein BGZ95_005188 [Linnemannia exigua]